MSRIEILTIGDELLDGRLVDSNSGWMSERLGRAGLEVARHTSVRDDRAELVAALTEAAGRADAVLVAGGLGPTSDDLTAECAAAAFSRPVARVPEALEHARAFFAARGREMPEANAKQADLPEGSTILANPVGTAVGFCLDHGGCRLYFMPGVPHEMECMVEHEVLPDLVARVAAEPPLVATLKVFGLGESDVAQRLEGPGPLVPAAGRLMIQYRATFPEIHVRLVLRGGSDDSLELLLATARDRLGRHVFASGLGTVATTLAATAVAALYGAGVTVALHDEAIGGRAAAALADADPEGRTVIACDVRPPSGADAAELAAAVRERFCSHLGAGLSWTADGLPVVAVIGAPGTEPLRRELPFRFDPDRLRRLTAHTLAELLRRAAGAHG